MNPKLATALIALSLPLAGCGNKGPLVLPQKPVPVEADMPTVEPPADAATPQTDANEAGDPATDASPEPATDATSDDETPPPPPVTDGGNG